MPYPENSTVTKTEFDKLIERYFPNKLSDPALVYQARRLESELYRSAQK